MTQFVVVSIEKHTTTSITFFEDVILLIPSGIFSFGLLAFHLLKQMDISDLMEKFLLHPPFRENGQFLWLIGVCSI